jgi:transposase
MPVGTPIEQHIKDEVVLRIRDGGLKISDAAEQYSVSTKTIYNWLRAGIVDGSHNLNLEVNRLRRELEQAYKVLGKLTAQTQRPKG